MSRLSIIKKSLLWEEVYRLATFKPIQYIFSTLVIGLLMMFLTLIVGLSSHLSDVSSGLTDKLGMYFYISQNQSGDAVNTKIVTLMKELENAQIPAQYLSKEDALQAFQKKLPSIAKNLQDYNIDAWLPATLYINIHSEKQHKALTTILPQYSDIIDNVGDLWDTTSVRAQEQRVMKALDFAYFIKWLSIWLIIIFSLVMGAVVLMLLYFKLKQFENLLSLKKTLWATNEQMRTPFLVFIGLVLWVGYIVSLLLTILLGIISMWRDQSLVYFSQLLGVEGMATGIWSLLFNGYLAVLLLLFALTAIIWFVSSLIIELKIKRV